MQSGEVNWSVDGWRRVVSWMLMWGLPGHVDFIQEFATWIFWTPDISDEIHGERLRKHRSMFPNEMRQKVGERLRIHESTPFIFHKDPPPRRDLHGEL